MFSVMLLVMVMQFVLTLEANRPKGNGDSSNMLDADQNCGSTSCIPLVDEEVEKESLLHEERESQKEISCYGVDC
ncbi:hypothetical protein A2U01_0061602 [Trifolium medium]|uniref:Secreted protein n=1 Tax=Trifolium medium TaxID=97028 RepID=A0A392RVG8_9FABA|nr:hypothetical protein [Trifolium medium]